MGTNSEAELQDEDSMIGNAVNAATGLSGTGI